jgi:arsenate reductase
MPHFPGLNKKINWSFKDPSTLSGSYDEKLHSTRIIRDKIKHAVEQFIVT